MHAPSPRRSVSLPPRRPESIQVVGIGELQVTDRPDHVLATYALGSCVGLTLYDPVARVGGMLHAMLPLSRLAPEDARARPAMYTDTGVMALLRALFDLGARRKQMIARVAGGAATGGLEDPFRTGQRNIAVLRKILWKNEVFLDAASTGGEVSRTMFLYLSTGQTSVRIKGREFDLHPGITPPTVAEDTPWP